MSLKHFTQPTSPITPFSLVSPVKSPSCLSNLQQMLHKPFFQPSHAFDNYNQLPVASDHILCCKHPSKKAKYVSPPFYLCSACAVQYALQKKPIQPINKINIRQNNENYTEIQSQKTDNSLDLSNQEGKVEEVIRKIEELIKTLNQNNQSQQLKNIVTDKEQQKAEIQKKMDLIKQKIEKETIKQLQRVDKLYKPNIDILEKITNKSISYSRILMKMKQDLIQKESEFFLNDEDLHKLLEEYKKNIDKIEKYRKTAQNMAMLVQKITLNQKKQIKNDEFQLIQKNKILKNNSHRTPRLEKSENKPISTISTIDVCSPKKQLKFKAINISTQKKHPTVLQIPIQDV